ncbi:MAG: 50S ribosomal protein L17 [Chloroflexi bacterium]|nr:50S ribosomal protein L17 [Chloroflexota bacterium]
MPHRVAGRHLGRTTGERRALFRNLMVSLLQREKIQTTEAKAKAIQADVEKLISLAGEDNPHNRQLALSIVPNPLTVAKLFDVIGPRCKERTGGYTRITKIGIRRGDAAPIVQLELVES